MAYILPPTPTIKPLRVAPPPPEETYPPPPDYEAPPPVEQPPPEQGLEPPPQVAPPEYEIPPYFPTPGEVAPLPYEPPPQFEEIPSYLEEIQQVIDEQFPQPEEIEPVTVPREAFGFEELLREQFGYVPPTEGADIFSDIEGLRDLFSDAERELSPERFQEELKRAKKAGTIPEELTDEQLEAAQQRYMAERTAQLEPLLRLKDIILPFAERVSAQREAISAAEQRRIADAEVESMRQSYAEEQSVYLSDNAFPVIEPLHEKVQVGQTTVDSIDTPIEIAAAIALSPIRFTWDFYTNEEFRKSSLAEASQALSQLNEVVRDVPLVGGPAGTAVDLAGILMGGVGGILTWESELGTRLAGYRAVKIARGEWFLEPATRTGVEPLQSMQIGDPDELIRLNQTLATVEDKDAWRISKWWPSMSNDSDKAVEIVSAIKSGMSDEYIDEKLANPLSQALYSMVYDPLWLVPGPGWALKLKGARYATLATKVDDISKVAKVGEVSESTNVLKRVFGLLQTAPSRALNDVQDIHMWVDRWVDTRIFKSSDDLLGVVRGLALRADDAAKQFIHADPMTVLGAKTHDVFASIGPDTLEQVTKHIIDKPVWEGAPEAYKLLPASERAAYYVDEYTKKSDLVKQILPLVNHEVIKRYGIAENKGLSGLGVDADNLILAVKSPLSSYFLMSNPGYYVRNYLSNAVHAIVDNGFSLRYFGGGNVARLDKAYKTAGITSRPGGFSPTDVVDVIRELRGEKSPSRGMNIFQKITGRLAQANSTIEGEARAAVVMKAFDDYVTRASRFASKGGKIEDIPRSFAGFMEPALLDRITALAESGDLDTLNRLYKTFKDGAGKIPASAAEFLSPSKYPGMSSSRLRLVDDIIRKSPNGERAADDVAKMLKESLAEINKDRAAAGLHQLKIEGAASLRTFGRHIQGLADELGGDYATAKSAVIRYLAERDQYRAKVTETLREVMVQSNVTRDKVDDVLKKFSESEFFSPEVRAIVKEHPNIVRFMESANKVGDPHFKDLIKITPRFNESTGKFIRQPGSRSFQDLYMRGTDKYGEYSDKLPELHGKLGELIEQTDIDIWARKVVDPLRKGKRLEDWLGQAILNNDKGTNLAVEAFSRAKPEVTLPNGTRAVVDLPTVLYQASQGLTKELWSAWRDLINLPAFAADRRSLRAITKVALHEYTKGKDTLRLYRGVAFDSGTAEDALKFPQIFWSDDPRVAVRRANRLPELMEPELLKIKSGELSRIDFTGGVVIAEDIKTKDVLAFWGATPQLRAGVAAEERQFILYGGRNYSFAVLKEKATNIVKDLSEAQRILRLGVVETMKKAGALEDDLGSWSPRLTMDGLNATGEDIVRWIEGRAQRATTLPNRGLADLPFHQVEIAGTWDNFDAWRYLDDLSGALREKGGQFERSLDLPQTITRSQADHAAKYLERTIRSIGDIRMAAKSTAEAAADWSLHNYGSRFGYQRVAQFIFPWELWTTRTMAKGVVRLADRPALAHLLQQYRDNRDKWGYLLSALYDPEEPMDMDYALERYRESQKGVPDWLKNEFKLWIPKSWGVIPESLRRDIAVDPIKAFFGVVGDPYIDRDLEDAFGHGFAEVAGSFASPSPLIMSAARGLGLLGPQSQKEWWPINPLARFVQSVTSWPILRATLVNSGIDVPPGGIQLFGMGSRTRDFRYRQLVDAEYRKGGYTLQEAADALQGKDNRLSRIANENADLEMSLRGLGSNFLGFPISTQAAADVARREASAATWEIVSQRPRAEWDDAFKELTEKYGEGIPSKIRDAANEGSWDFVQREVTRLTAWDKLNVVRDKYSELRTKPENFGYQKLQKLHDDERRDEDRVMESLGLTKESFLKMNMNDKYLDYYDDLLRRAEAAQHPERFGPTRFSEIMVQPVQDQQAFVLAWAQSQYYDIPNYFKDPQTGWIDWKSAIWAQREYIANQSYVDPLLLDTAISVAPRSISDAVMDAYQALGFEKWLAADQPGKAKLEATTPSLGKIIAYVQLYVDKDGNQKWSTDDITNWVNTITIPSIGEYVDQWDKWRINQAAAGKPFLTSHGLVGPDNVDDYVAALKEIEKFSQANASYKSAKAAYEQRRISDQSKIPWWDRFASNQAGQANPFPADQKPTWTDRLQRWFAKETKQEPTDIFERVEQGLPDWIPNPYRDKLVGPDTKIPDPPGVSLPTERVPVQEGQPNYPVIYDQKLSDASGALAQLDPRDTQYKQKVRQLEQQTGISEADIRNYRKWNDTPQEAIRAKFMELVAVPGGEAWAAIKDSKDRKLKDSVLDATVPPEIIVAAIMGDPVYSKRGFTPDMIWSIIDKVPTLAEWWRSDEPPEARAIAEQVDAVWDEINRLGDQAKKLADAKQWNEYWPLREQIAKLVAHAKSLDARHKQILAGQGVPLFEGTPQNIQDILKGVTGPEFQPEPVSRSAPSRGGGGGGGAAPRAPSEPRESFEADGTESPQLEALKRQLAKVPARFRSRWIAMIRALRAGEKPKVRIF